MWRLDCGVNVSSTLCLLGSWSQEGHSGVCIGILGQVWYLIVSIPDLRTLTYFAFLEMLFTCLLQEKLLLMVSPRYFESDFVVLAMDEVVVSNWIFLFLMHKNSHFSALKAICHFFFTFVAYRDLGVLCSPFC